MGKHHNFYGMMIIMPINRPPFALVADWAYRADVDCWYGNGGSYPAEICRIQKEGESHGVHVHSAG